MNIALFGLGIIGSSWARLWQEDAHDLRTWNRTPKPGAPGFQPDPQAAARDRDLIAIVVADPPAVDQVLSAIEPELGPHCVVAQHSTIGAADTAAFARRVQARGAAFLDMPFTGSKDAAAARKAVFYIGGDTATLDRVRPAYAPISRALLEVGPVGRAMSLKLALNLLVANTYQSLAESIALAERAGVPRAAFFDLIEQHVGRSGLSDLKKPKILSGDYSPHFSIKHMHKDLRLALQHAAELHQPLPQTQALIAAYRKAEENGWGGLDFSALIKTLDG